MKPTRELLDRAANNHRDWLHDFEANGTTKTAEEIIEDHDCKFGIFLASIDRESRLDPGYRETCRIHVSFHYYCSVLVTLNSLDIPIHPNLHGKIKATSLALVDSLTKWKI